MNQEEEKHLKDQLEWATSRELPADADLDAESTALRESWLAFTQLMDAIDRDEEGHEVVEANGTAASSSGRWLLASMSIAATLLLAVALLWMLNQPSDTAHRTPPVATVNPEQLKPQTSVVQSDTDGVADGLYAWDDSLDEEIALAEDALIYIRQHGSTLDDRFDSLYDEIEEIEDEFFEKTL